MDDIDWTVSIVEGIPILTLESKHPAFAGVRKTKLRKVYARWAFDIEPYMDDDLTLAQKSFMVIGDPVGVLLEANYKDLPERALVQQLITASRDKKPWAIICQFIENGQKRAVGWEITHRVRKTIDLDRWPVKLTDPE